MRRALLTAITLVSIAYPFLCWLWRERPTALTALAVGMAVLWALRAALSPDTMRGISLALAGLFAITAVMRQGQWLLWYPFAVNALMLALFAASLWRGTPMVERFARLRHADLPERAIPYLRNVTRLWCAFFILNGGVVVALIAHGNLRWWALYTGGIAYLLMGMLLGGEWIYRQWAMKQHKI